MSPWWSKPTSDGGADAETPASSGPLSVADGLAAAEAIEEEDEETVETEAAAATAPKKPRRRRSRRGGKATEGSAEAEATEEASEEASAEPVVATAEEKKPPASKAKPAAAEEETPAAAKPRSRSRRSPKAKAAEATDETAAAQTPDAKVVEKPSTPPAPSSAGGAAPRLDRPVSERPGQAPPRHDSGREARAESGRGDQGRSDQGRGDQSRSAARGESGRAESGRTESGRAEARTDTRAEVGRVEIRGSEGAAPTWMQVRDLLREIVSVTGSGAEPAPVAAAVERKIALFCDLENLVLGIKDSESDRFDVDLVLERLVEKGKIIVKRAYADWTRYTEYKRAFHEAGIELIDIPQRQYSGKNSADIKMVVDAMDISWSKEHLDTFVILSGDSDFTPLVTKLKENDKRVIGVGLKASSSHLLIDNCDEFLYYEDLWRDGRKKAAAPAAEAGLSKKEAELATLLVESIQALERENKSVLWGSMIKQTMQRKKPAFNESYYGFSTFSALLEDAEKRGIVKLRRDSRSGSWVVTGLGSKRA